MVNGTAHTSLNSIRRLDQVNRQISFTTASINDPPRARGQFITVSHSSQHFHLADFFRHELERDNRSKNKYSTRTNHKTGHLLLGTSEKNTFSWSYRHRYCLCSLLPSKHIQKTMNSRSAVGFFGLGAKSC